MMPDALAAAPDAIRAGPRLRWLGAHGAETRAVAAEATIAALQAALDKALSTIANAVSGNVRNK